MMVAVLVIAALQAGSLPVQSAVRPGSARAVAVAPRPVPRAARPDVARTFPPKSGARVVVDAGHGGPDVGGPMRMGNKLYEKDITLQLALKVGEVLRQRGVDVVYTRTTDTLIALSDRGKIANQANGDVFISIHVNAANPHWQNPAAARGFETYFL